MRNSGSLGTDELCARSRSGAPGTEFVRGDRRREVGCETTNECRGLNKVRIEDPLVVYIIISSTLIYTQKFNNRILDLVVTCIKRTLARK